MSYLLDDKVGTVSRLDRISPLSLNLSLSMLSLSLSISLYLCSLSLSLSLSLSWLRACNLRWLPPLVGKLSEDIFPDVSQGNPRLQDEPRVGCQLRKGGGCMQTRKIAVMLPWVRLHPPPSLPKLLQKSFPESCFM